MIYLCWAAKGGSGTTTIAGSLALSLPPCLIVDLAGDIPILFGRDTPTLPGVYDWLASEAPVERLDRLVTTDNDLHLLHAGSRSSPPTPGRWALLAKYLAASGQRVVIDAGTGPPRPELADAATHRWLITRPCYMSLRTAMAQQAAQPACTPTGVVVIAEPGRSLRTNDISTCIGAPVVAEIPVDPAIARASDAGLFATRLPRPLGTSLRHAA